MNFSFLNARCIGKCSSTCCLRTSWWNSSGLIRSGTFLCIAQVCFRVSSCFLSAECIAWAISWYQRDRSRKLMNGTQQNWYFGFLILILLISSSFSTYQSNSSSCWNIPGFPWYSLGSTLSLKSTFLIFLMISRFSFSWILVAG